MKHFLALALMTLGIMAQAQERVLLDETDKYKDYIYPSTINKSDFGITVWQERIYAKPQLDTSKNKYYTSSKVQELIDCNGMRSAFIAITDYSKNGNVVYSGSQSEYAAYTKLEPMAPGTVGWAIIEEVCRRYNQGDY